MWVLQNCAGNSNALLLTARKLRALFAYLGLITGLEPLNKAMGICCPRGILTLVGIEAGWGSHDYGAVGVGRWGLGGRARELGQWCPSYLYFLLGCFFNAVGNVLGNISTKQGWLLGN